jgi:hypothetical protein
MNPGNRPDPLPTRCRNKPSTVVTKNFNLQTIRKRLIQRAGTTSVTLTVTPMRDDPDCTQDRTAESTIIHLPEGMHV